MINVRDQTSILLFFVILSEVKNEDDPFRPPEALPTRNCNIKEIAFYKRLKYICNYRWLFLRNIVCDMKFSSSSHKQLLKSGNIL